MEFTNFWSSGLLPAFIGALVAFICNFYLQTRKDKKEIKAIRTLLKIEIQKNMSSIEKISVAKGSKFKGYDDSVNCINGQKLANIKAVQFNNNLWNTKTPLYAIALSESEILAIESFYLNLEKAIDIHLEIKRLSHEMEKETDPFKRWFVLFKSIGEKFGEYDSALRVSLEEGYSISLLLSDGKFSKIR